MKMYQLLDEIHDKGSNQVCIFLRNIILGRREGQCKKLIEDVFLDINIDFPMNEKTRGI